MKKIIPSLFRWLSIVFVMGTVIYFIGSLGFLTDVQKLKTFASYLDTANILAYYNKANSFNNDIFIVATFLTIISAFILILKLNQKQIKKKSFIFIMIIIGINLIATIYFTIATTNIVNEFNALDLGWKSNFDPELYRYTPPSNYWINFTLITTIISLVGTIIYTPVVILHYLNGRERGEVNETRE